MTDSTELKECPFCRSTDVNYCSGDAAHRWVECPTCFAEGPTGKTEKAARLKWNTRTPKEQEN